MKSNMPKIPFLERMKAIPAGWTADSINNFQKTLFPFIFILFTFFYVLAANFKWGQGPPDGDID